ncbi:MAG TPA: protein phosphatase 2C domain-containing protein [Vicinamibacterales bacterium]
MIQAHAATDAGPVRPVNEDAFLIDQELGLYAVADGIGGHNAGEVASRLALDALAAFVRRSATDTDLSWPYGVLAELSYGANRLRTGIHLANRRVFRAAESQDDYTGMGTTMVAVLIDGGLRAAIANVGDSRIYLWRAGEVTRLTVDDSWVEALRAQGLSADELARHPMRHVLTNVVGARDKVDVHVRELALEPGDRLLLCSDGVHEPLDEAGIARLLGNGSAESAAAELVRAALDRGGRDNATAVVLEAGAPA